MHLCPTLNLTPYPEGEFGRICTCCSIPQHALALFILLRLGCSPSASSPSATRMLTETLLDASLQILDSNMILHRNLSLHHHVPTNRRHLRVLGSFHSASAVLEMCAKNPHMACVPIILNSDQAGMWVHGAIWPIYAAFPSLPAETVNTTSLMPHVGMIPILSYEKGRYEKLYGKTNGKFMFAARKRDLAQRCMAMLTRMVNDNTEGRWMRIQGKIQLVNVRVTTLSCDHAENTALNGCQPLMCPRCFDYVGSKHLPEDLYDWDRVRDYDGEYEPHEDDVDGDDVDGLPAEVINFAGQNANINRSNVRRSFWWTPLGAATAQDSGPRPRSSVLTALQVEHAQKLVYPTLPLCADARGGDADRFADISHWDHVLWSQAKKEVKDIGIYPFYNPLWDVPNFDVCHSTPVDEMHAWRLGVLLRLAEYALLHLLTSLNVDDLDAVGPQVKERLVKRIRSVGQSRANKHDFVAEQMTGWYDEALIKAKIIGGKIQQAPRKNAGKPHKIGSLSAAETFQFVEDLPFILDELLHGLPLKPDAEVSLEADIQLIVRMLKLYRRVTAPFYTAEELTRIHVEVCAIIPVFGTQLTFNRINVPKTHLLMHLTSDMARFGRTINYTTEAMERRHQDVKSLADVTNRKANFHEQILKASTRRDLLDWSRAGNGDDEARAAMAEEDGGMGEDGGNLSDGDSNDKDHPHLAGPKQMCSITGCRASGNFPLWDFLAEHNQTTDPARYLLVAPACVPGHKDSLFRFQFEDVLNKTGWLLQKCPVLQTLHILTRNFLHNVVWKGTSGGVAHVAGGWKFPEGDEEVLEWLANFTNRQLFQRGNTGISSAGVQVFNCLKLTVKTISLTSLRMRASPEMGRQYHGQAMAGATVMWLPYATYLVPPVAKEDMDLLGNPAHMKLVRFATVECFFRFQSKSVQKKSAGKIHDMALIREFHTWDCKQTACSFDSIQLASCAEPKGDNMLQVIEVDRILGNVVLVRNQVYPTIPSSVNMDLVCSVPGVRKDSDKVTGDGSRSNNGKAKKAGKSQKKKSAGSAEKHVPMEEDLHSVGDGSALWHVHPEWKSRRTRFDAGIHSVVQ
jgi:hypothetical protein